MNKEMLNTKEVASYLNIEVIRSREFRAKVGQLGGYNTTDLGKIISD